MEEILKIDTVDQYNKLFGFETRHPQVGVVSFDTAESQGNYRMTMGFYSVFLKETAGCRINYGKTSYDFDDQTVICIAPGQTVGYTDVEGIPKKSVGLLFHPDLIHGTPLAAKMQRYSFFSYAQSEALHLSEWERNTIVECLNKLDRELDYPVDKHSRSILCSHIELILDYCLRFYDRQFCTRETVNNSVLARFEQLLNEYFSSEENIRNGLPTVKFFADKICLSPGYFGDIVKKETGKTAQEYIQQKVIELSKSYLVDNQLNVSEIAYSLGFQYPQHFIRLFKKNVGCTPGEFRKELAGDAAK